LYKISPFLRASVLIPWLRPLRSITIEIRYQLFQDGALFARVGLVDLPLTNSQTVLSLPLS